MHYQGKPQRSNYIMVVLAIVLCFGTHKSSHAQSNDYPGYFELLRNADSLTNVKQYHDALQLYQEAFSLVQYVHINFLEQASTCAKKAKNDTLEAHWNNEIDRIESGFNDSLITVINDLFEEDQRIRKSKYSKAARSYNSCASDTNCDQFSKEMEDIKTLYDEIIHVDSLNVQTILSIISDFGFPGEELVGSEAYHNAFIILLHFDKDAENSVLGTILDSALMRGQILPEDYAWIIDRRLAWGQGKSPYFYEMPMGLEFLTPEQIVEIDQRRAAIGLPATFENREIVRKGNTITVRTIK